jgi:hypothetical protein
MAGLLDLARKRAEAEEYAHFWDHRASVAGSSAECAHCIAEYRHFAGEAQRLSEELATARRALRARALD